MRSSCSGRAVGESGLDEQAVVVERVDEADVAQVGHHEIGQAAGRSPPGRGCWLSDALAAARNESRSRARSASSLAWCSRSSSDALISSTSCRSVMSAATPTTRTPSHRHRPSTTRPRDSNQRIVAIGRGPPGRSGGGRSARRADRSSISAANRVPVLLVDHGQDVRRRRPENDPGSQSEQLLERRRDRDPVGGQVPVPAAEPTGGEGEVETGRSLPQLVLDHGPLDGQPDARCRPTRRKWTSSSEYGRGSAGVSAERHPTAGRPTRSWR